MKHLLTTILVLGLLASAGGVEASSRVVNRAGVTKQTLALDFTPSTMKVNTGSDFIGAATTTVVLWIKPRTAGSGGGRIIENGKFAFWMNDADDLAFSSDYSTTITTVGSGPISHTNWNCAAVTRKWDGKASIYVGGVLKSASDGNSGTPVSGTTNVFIGNATGNNRPFDGGIDQVRVFNRILTVTEIADLCKHNLPTDWQTSMTRQYLFDGGSRTTALDTSVNNTSGTITNAVPTAGVTIPVASRTLSRVGNRN